MTGPTSSRANAGNAGAAARPRSGLLAAFTLESNGTKGLAPIVSLSGKGARLDLPVEVGQAEGLTIEITFPGDGATRRSTLFTLKAKVIWTVADQPQPPFPTGVQFLGLDEGKKRKFLEALKSLPS